MNKLLIVGTVAFDAIETPFGKTDKILGGAGNTLVYLLLFNVQSAIVSVVGDDFPQEYLDLLTSRNIDISGLEVVQGGKTFFWSGRYHNDLNSRDTLDTH
jgi:sugar/nucleoside kinase (ribokinase family)